MKTFVILTTPEGEGNVFLREGGSSASSPPHVVF